MPDPTTSLPNLRRAIDHLPPHQRGDPRSVVLAEIERLHRMLDSADADEMAAFRMAFRGVFPEFCDHEDEEGDLN